MDLKFSDDQLRALVTEALFSQLDQDAVKKMITSALGLLMVPQTNQYGSRTNNGRLQEAVESALLTVAREICAQEFAKNEIRESVAGMVREAIEKVMVKEREKTIDAMAASFARTLWQVGAT